MFVTLTTQLKVNVSTEPVRAPYDRDRIIVLAVIFRVIFRMILKAEWLS